MLRIDTIEDCLEALAGFTKESVSFKLNKEDYTIMHSIARQTFRGTALTDRQFALMQTKLIPYQEQFDVFEVPFKHCIKTLRLPLRSINREKYIRVEDTKIKVRFPFKKSDIMLINELSHQSWNAEGYTHQKGSHEHFFEYNEINVLNLLDRFKDKLFEIDKELTEVYNLITEIRSNKHLYVPGIYDMELQNVDDNMKLLMEAEVGPLSKDTFLKYVDRKFKYGLEHIDAFDPMTSVEKLACRQGIEYNNKPSQQTLELLLSDFWELDRFPLVVILDKMHAEKQLHSMLNFYRDILNPEQQSVLFRLDKTTHLETESDSFNQLIKDRKLNNWVDKTTKVVYISKSKLPKLLINSEWIPNTCIAFDSAIDRTVSTYITSTCDLVVFREEYMSPFRRHSKIYG